MFWQVLFERQPLEVPSEVFIAELIQRIKKYNHRLFLCCELETLPKTIQQGQGCARIKTWEI